MAESVNPVFPDDALLEGLGIQVAPGVRLGRVAREGYQRGWGLQFGGLAEKVAVEPLYAKSLHKTEIASWVEERKRKNLYLILTRFLPRLGSRDVIEFGSYRGGNAVFMALVMREVDPTAKVYALDTFEGMPATDSSRDVHHAGDFSDVGFETLQGRIRELGLTNLILVKGLFQDTFPALDAGPFGLAHIDCDIYSAVKYSQDAVWPRMTPGGYVVYDDADYSSCLGATEAVEEMIMDRRIHSEQVWPHYVFRAQL
jgi:predicted O-methyltransferase YrrM